MQEYVSDAIVLSKESLRDQDGRYAVFTERFGKVVGKTVSSRKITSKLAPHLEPGTRTKIRFIEKNGTQIVDALKIEKSSHSFADLHHLSRLLPEGVPETDLWEMLNRSFTWHEALRILGWDPEEAACANCTKTDTAAFFIPRQEFFCTACSSKLPKNQIILV